ncbi:AtpZ/AtpI family protein [Devosia alba]|uniref:AtpZ/AtpI family protein n=1 Tax=Devosia alba TaxID=3152360 RepID=UPI0032644098
MTNDHDKEDRIGRDAARKQAARDNPGPSPLRGISVFGMIGWAVAVPTVAGAFLGLWLDGAWPQAFSWSVALILGGVVIGAFLAWRWMDRGNTG